MAKAMKCSYTALMPEEGKNAGQPIAALAGIGNDKDTSRFVEAFKLGSFLRGPALPIGDPGRFQDAVAIIYLPICYIPKRGSDSPMGCAALILNGY
jgi:hypothetical protein